MRKVHAAFKLYAVPIQPPNRAEFLTHTNSFYSGLLPVEAAAAQPPVGRWQRTCIIPGHTARQCFSVLPATSPVACFLWKQRRPQPPVRPWQRACIVPTTRHSSIFRSPICFHRKQATFSRPPAATKSEPDCQPRHGASPIWSAAACRSFDEATRRREENQSVLSASIASSASTPRPRRPPRLYDTNVTVPGCNSNNSAIICGTKGDRSSILLERTRKTITPKRRPARCCCFTRFLSTVMKRSNSAAASRSRPLPRPRAIHLANRPHIMAGERLGQPPWETFIKEYLHAAVSMRRWRASSNPWIACSRVTEGKSSRNSLRV